MNRTLVGRRRAAAAVAATALVVTVAPVGAQAAPTNKAVPLTSTAVPTDAPPAGMRSWNQVMETQNRLHAVADRLRAAGRAKAGFTGLAMDVPANKVVLYWKGTVPASVKKAAAQGRATAKVDVKSARHSLRQLEDAARLAMRRHGADLREVSIPADGRALQVAVAGQAAAGRVTLDRALRQAGQQVALQVTTETASAEPLYSRVDDTAPFWGGARMRNASTGGGCSTGFGIRSNATGATSILTAGHCGNNGQQIRTGTNANLIGTVTDDRATEDTLRLPTSAGGRIYDGGVGVGEFSKPVTGYHYSYAGQWVCTSGSYSGARCDIRVVNTNNWIWVGTGWFAPMTRAEHVLGQSAGGNGDSGGPIFDLTADWSKVYAVGTLSAGDPGAAPATCTGVPSSATRRCSSRIWFAPVVDSLWRYNSGVVIGG
ncbi:hypothetical protein GCM10010124_00380 [Pilimelia terevasa]|uniref:Uncharacterized protein n=1 Tax=Pilimelia terevasa TaxID=53372 RepID=A0A8J3FDK7_9ACTN|nr:alpha-lytic protease prodomain-containing protein [Pilimelia terevasa]GGK11676.1 hypothetical protein GCM10010124_00380 [Pilimelia terevasa]